MEKVVMKFIFDTKYSETELEFLSSHNCKIISEIKLSKMDLPEHEIPRRMFKYGGGYFGEIYDDESNKLVWAALRRWRGVYHFSTYYEDLDVLEQGL
ncbi:MAG: hypothetical protein LIP16_05235 [Clostridium sp.]|nr:hypothetical protein [Clostridium sp.]